MNRIIIEFPEDYPSGKPRILAIEKVVGMCDFSLQPVGQTIGMETKPHTVILTWPKSPVASAPQADATQPEEA